MPYQIFHYQKNHPIMVDQGVLYMLPYILPLLLCTYVMCYHYTNLHRLKRNINFPTGNDSFYIVRRNPWSNRMSILYTGNRKEEFKTDDFVFEHDNDTQKCKIIKLNDIKNDDKQLDEELGNQDKLPVDDQQDKNHSYKTSTQFSMGRATTLQIISDIEDIWKRKLQQKPYDAYNFMVTAYTNLFVQLRVRVHNNYLYIYADRSDIVPFDIVYLPEIGKFNFESGNFIDLLNLMNENNTIMEKTDDDTLNTFGVFISNGFLDDHVLLVKKGMIACFRGLNVLFICYLERRYSFGGDTVIIRFKGRKMCTWSMLKNKFLIFVIKRNKIAYKTAREYFESLDKTRLYTTLQPTQSNKEGLVF
ncbi:hypothetical protein THOM_0140 [Trachipleistophora hominis]|uniref:Uncharacterized protein n=1 Tax=Trachipleistophora hominis TaxID=72359 RepID=L7JZG5_TRAHO|nr:hypothetical protein THOM_0140 [Trachipleistophora hominis]